VSFCARVLGRNDGACHVDANILALLLLTNQFSRFFGLRYFVRSNGDLIFLPQRCSRFYSIHHHHNAHSCLSQKYVQATVATTRRVSHWSARKPPPRLSHAYDKAAVCVVWTNA
jgi:hypothetical protein